MNILVLIRLGDPKSYLKAVYDLEFCLPNYAPEHNYVVHDVALPLPGYVKSTPWHGIVLGASFLCVRFFPQLFQKTLARYDFIRTSPAFKIALPQDDYNCSAILDQWLVDWNVDLAYPVCSEGWDILYPRYSKVGRLKLGYTGYVDDAMIQRWQNPKPFEARRIDVSYRSNDRHKFFGKLGNEKSTMGERFAVRAANAGLKLDLSTRPEDIIPGAAWHDFLEDSKFVLGTNSGSSLLDPVGEIKRKVLQYLAEHPQASVAEVEAACYPGLDGQHVFTALSPRNIECALIKSVQILNPGHYSGILKPHEHYIPLEPDMSNYAQVEAAIRNVAAAKAIAEACKQAILNVPELRYSNHVCDLLAEIAQGTRQSQSQSKIESAGRAAAQKYKAYARVVTAPYWLAKRNLSPLNRVLVKLGIRKSIWGI